MMRCRRLADPSLQYSMRPDAIVVVVLWVLVAGSMCAGQSSPTTDDEFRNTTAIATTARAAPTTRAPSTRAPTPAPPTPVPTTPAPLMPIGDFVTAVGRIESAAIISRSQKEQRTVTLDCSKTKQLRWSSTGCRLQNAIFLKSDSSWPTGFNARYTNLFDPASIRCTATEISLSLNFDPFYDVPSGGDVISVYLSPAVAIGETVPWDPRDPNSRVTFIITESKAYESQVPPSVRWAAEISSTTALLPTAALLRKPVLAALVPRLQFLRSLAVCEFSFKYNLGRIQYPLQLPFGSSAFQYFIPVSPLNFALFVFVVVVDCAVFFAWARFKARTIERNLQLLPPGTREQARKRMEAGELVASVAQASGRGADRTNEDFYVLKVPAALPDPTAVSVTNALADGNNREEAKASGEAAADDPLSPKKAARLLAEAEDKVARTVQQRQLERDASGEANARKPYDAAVAPPAEAPPLPGDEQAKAELAKEAAEKKRPEEEERLANRTPDEVDRDLAAAETNPAKRAFIQFRRLRRRVTTFVATRFTILVHFLNFLGSGRLPSPWWFLLFLWAEPVVQSVLVVLWNLNDNIIVQLLLGVSLVPWTFLLIWIIRVLLIGFPMRFWDEDERLVLEESALRRAQRLEMRAEAAKEAARLADERVKAAEAAAEAKKAKADAEKLKEDEAKRVKSDANVEAAEEANADGAPQGDVRPTDAGDSVTAGSKPVTTSITDDPTTSDAQAPSPTSIEGHATEDEPKKADGGSTTPPDVAPIVNSFPKLPPRLFPKKTMFQFLMLGYGQWITTFTEPDRVDLEAKRKARRLAELQAEHEADVAEKRAKEEAEAERKRVEAEKVLADAEAKKNEAGGEGTEATAATKPRLTAEELAKTDEPTVDGAATNVKKDDDEDAGSVITHISDSQHRAKPVYTLCQPLDGPTLPSPEDAARCAIFARAYGDLFRTYRPMRHWFAIIELAVSILFGVLESVRTTLGCEVIAGPAMGLCLVYLVLLIVLRPGVAPADNILFTFAAAVQLWCCLFYLVFSLEPGFPELEATGTWVLNLLEFGMLLYLVSQAKLHIEPVIGWFARNARAWEARFPWTQGAPLGGPIGKLIAGVLAAKQQVVTAFEDRKARARLLRENALLERREAEKAAKEKAIADEAAKRRDRLVLDGTNLEMSLLRFAAPVGGSAGPGTTAIGPAAADDALSKPSAFVQNAGTDGTASRAAVRPLRGVADSRAQSDDEVSLLLRAGDASSDATTSGTATLPRGSRRGNTTAGASSSYNSREDESSDNDSAFSCSDSQCTCHLHSSESTERDGASSSEEVGPSHSARHRHHHHPSPRDRIRQTGGGVTSGDADASSSDHGSDCSCATLQFQDERGNLLTLRDVAARLREWQRRRNMPNINADLLPMPVEDLRQLIHDAGVDARRQDEALVTLLLELKANAGAATHPLATAEIGVAPPSAVVANAAANGNSKTQNGTSVADPPRPPVLSLHDLKTMDEFECFYHRRPRACCVVM
jgi:hypothetical protein